MKKNFKKFLAMFVSMSCLMSSFTGTVNAISIQTIEMKLDDNGHTVTPNGSSVISSKSIYSTIATDGTTYYGCDTEAVLMFDCEPNSDELLSILKENNYGAYIWIDSENPYVFYAYLKKGNGDEEYIIEKETRTNIKPHVEYVIDETKHEIRHYETGDVIQKFTSFTDDTYGIAYNDTFIIGDYKTGYGLLNYFSDGVNTRIEILETAKKFANINSGDIDYNNSIDITDLSQLSLCLLGEASLNPLQTEIADTTGDGTVNLSDLSRLKQFVSGKDITLGAK